MRVEGYTKKDGTVVQGYDREGSKKADEASAVTGSSPASDIAKFSASAAAYASASKLLSDPSSEIGIEELTGAYRDAKDSHEKVVSEIVSRGDNETASQHMDRLSKTREMVLERIRVSGDDRAMRNFLFRFGNALSAKAREVRDAAADEAREAAEAKSRSEDGAAYEKHYSSSKAALVDGDEGNPVGYAISSVIGNAKSEKEKAIAVDAAVAAVRESYPEMSDLEIADKFCRHEISEEGIHAYIDDLEMMEDFDLSVFEMISLANASESSWDADHILAGFPVDEDEVDSKILREIAYRQEKMGLNLKGEELAPGVETIDGGRYEPESEPDMDLYMRNQYPEGFSWAESGFLMSDGTLLDMSHGSGGRADDHRSINPTEASAEKWGWPKGSGEYSRWELLVQTLRRAGAMRIDGNSGIIHTENELTSAQERSIVEYVRDFDPDYVSIRVGDGNVDSIKDIEIDNPSSGEIIRAIERAYSEGRNEAKSMIRKGMVSGYTKKDGTVVKPYHTSRTKKAEDESSQGLGKRGNESDFEHLLRLDKIAEGIPVKDGYYSMSNAMEEAGLDPDASNIGDAEVADAIKQWIEKQQGDSGTGKGSGLLSSIGNPEPLSIRNEFFDRDLHRRAKKKFSEETGLSDDTELAKLAGLTDTSNVKIRYSDSVLDRDAPRGTMAANVTARNGAVSTRQIYRGEDGGLRIYNYFLEVKEGKRGQGMGSTLLARQVQNAVDAGFVEMKCEGTRSDGPNGEIGGAMSGYYVWPLLGYDGRAPKLDKDPRTQRSLKVLSHEVDEFWVAVSRLPDSAINAKKVSDFYKTVEGRQFWHRWGNTVNLSFDLREGSESLKKLNAYLEERGKK